MSTQPGKASARSVLHKFQALESQWRQYESKIATRSAEQSESLKKSALLSKGAQRADTSSEVKRAEHGHEASPIQSRTTSPQRHQLVPADYSGAGRPYNNAQPGSRQQESEDLAVQRASGHFLQQVEDSRRRYAFEVEELKAEASKWAEKRDAYAHDSQKASVHTAEMEAAAGEAEQKLERLNADIAQAKKRLTALDRAHESGIQSQEHERQAALQAFEQEQARQQHVLQAEHQAALQVMQTERATIGESLKAVTQQLHEAEAQHKHLVELEADLQRREDTFERQVRQQVQDFKDREARVAEAEQHALSYSSREAALTARQQSVVVLEDKAQQANAAAEYARKEADAMWDKQKDEARRLAEQVHALEDARNRWNAELAAREAGLSNKEEALAAEVRQKDADQRRRLAQEQQERARALSELRRLEADIGEAMRNLKGAQGEEEALRNKAMHLRDEIDRAELARDKALVAHNKAQAAGKDAQRAADEAAASGHSRLMVLQQKQEAVTADMQVAVRDQERWQAQWEAQKQDLQHELADLQHNIQAARQSAEAEAESLKAEVDAVVARQQERVADWEAAVAEEESALAAKQQELQATRTEKVCDVQTLDHHLRQRETALTSAEHRVELLRTRLENDA
ncbi:MAG: hypothetical protein FRX49_11084 [Trebouxia sp. A1-2]|nr:MAG: hypothetical protein FRX49_11084 [Trebouxia sp. A1-2]